jgi:hypothetical protein
MTDPADDYDNPWKDAIRHDFPSFLAFFFPAVFGEIDWSAGFTFLERELRAVTRRSERGRRRTVDVLARVRRLDGAEAWVYVHIEVQSQHDADLPERVFVYHYRLFDRYRAPVASLVVLADSRPDWRPETYGHDLFGCEVRMRFPVAKLADYSERLDELTVDPNPFAVVTMAHLLTQRTRGDDLARYQAKRRLTRLLYERGWNKRRVQDFFRVIDWMMQVPEELDQRLESEIDVWEEEDFNVKYLSSIERMAMARGEAKGEAIGEAKLLERLLTRRFGSLPEPFGERLRQATTEQLEAWFDRALDSEDLAGVFDGTPADAGSSMHRA